MFAVNAHCDEFWQCLAVCSSHVSWVMKLVLSFELLKLQLTAFTVTSVPCLWTGLKCPPMRGLEITSDKELEVTSEKSD